MNGFTVAEQGHVAVLTPPQNITGGVTAQAFAMKNYKHASILVIAGAEATQDTGTLLVNICTNAAGATPIAIPFNYYFQALGGVGNDVLGKIQNAPATGLVLAAGNWPPNGLIVIEIDANELEGATPAPLAGSLGVDSYLQVVLPSPAAADFACIVAILSGARFANVASPTVTT